MKKNNVKKEYVITFLDSIKNDFSRLGEKNVVKKEVGFDLFKVRFCDKRYINKDTDYNKEIYDKISSDTSKFFTKIRDFIIDTFTDNLYYCPYCSKSPLIYFDGESNKRKRMFQFDHFLPKKIYPEFAINFYNLVPSCNACNHLKGSNDPLEGTNIDNPVFHPYFGWIYRKNSEIKIIEGKVFSDNFIFYGDKHTLTKKHAKEFHLDKIYLESQDTFNEFKFMHDKYTKIKADKLGKYGKISSKSDDDFKNQYFAGYYSGKEEDILKFSNGKFKKDLIENMKL